MALRLSLQIDGDSKGAKQALVETARGVKELGATAPEISRLSSAFKGLDAELQKETATVNRQQRAVAGVVDQLKFEGEQLRRNSHDRAAYDAMRAAGVTTSSAEGRAIGALAITNQKLRDEQDRLARSGAANKAMFRDVAVAASLAGGPVGGLVGQFGAITQGASRMGGAVLGTVTVLAALATGATAAVNAYAKLEYQQVRTNNQLRATGFASGQSGASLNASAAGLAKPGTQSIAEIRAAQAELLRFRAVSGDVFDETLRNAQSLANTGLASLSGAATAFGRALTNPVEGLDALREAGLRFTPVQQKLIEDLFKSGRQLESQREILRLSAEQLGNATPEAAGTLVASYGRLSNATNTMMERWGDATAKGANLKGMIDGLASTIDGFANRPSQTKAGNFITSLLALGNLPGSAAMLANLAGGGMRDTREPISNRAKTNTTFTDRFDTEGIVSSQRSGLGGLKPEHLNSAANRAVTGIAGESGLNDQQLAAFNKVNIALSEQAKLYAMSEAERAKYIERGNAQVQTEGQVSDATRRAAGAINERVNAMMAAQFTRGATEQIQQQTAAVEIEAQTFGMSAGKAAAYRTEHELLARARVSGIALSPAQIAAIKGEAQAFGEATNAVERYRAGKQAMDAVSGQVADSLFGWASNARTASDAIKDLTNSLSRMVMQGLLAGQGPLAGIFGTQTGGGLLGMLGPSPASLSAGTVGGTGGWFDKGGFTGNISRKKVAGVVHGGEYVINADATSKHYSLLQAINDNRPAPGYASGGYVGAPMFAPPRGMSGSSGSDTLPPIAVNVYEAPGTKSQVKQSRTPDGRPQIDIMQMARDGAVAAIGSGEADSVLRSRHGANLTMAKR